MRFCDLLGTTSSYQTLYLISDIITTTDVIVTSVEPSSGTSNSKLILYKLCYID